ncbi:MAG: AMP-binding protein [Bacteroidia bacterium]|nr:AMP-binding protein [Bacteroidia bacterium]
MTDSFPPSLIPEINRTANMFHALGIREMDTVALLLPDITESYIALWAGLAVASVLPIHPGLQTYQIADLINHSQAKILVTTAPFGESDLWDRVESIRPHLPSVKIILQTDLTDNLGTLQRIGMRLALRKKGKAEKIAGQEIGDFNRTRAKFPEDKLLFPPAAQNHTLWLHSSATHHEPGLSACSPQEIKEFARHNRMPHPVSETPKYREISVGDTLVNLDKVSESITSHPGVNQVVAVPSPDSKNGWVPVVYLIANNNNFSPKEVYDFAVQNMASPAMVPQGIRVVNQFPQSVSGEVSLYQLTRSEIENTFKKIPAIRDCNAVCTSDGKWTVSLWLTNLALRDEVLHKIHGYPLEFVFCD